MVNNETFENLKALEKILVKKYKLQAKVEETPKQLDILETALAETKKEFIAKNADYEDVKSKVLKLELELEEAQKSREKGEKGMDDISTHREYEALEKQINEAKLKEEEIRQAKQREDKILNDLQEQLKEIEDDISAQESELSEKKENLNSEISGYKETLAELKAEEDKITPNIDQEILFKFERIIQRNSEGIVSVRNGVCSGCHMILPAQFANTVRKSENINFCPYCSRILFYEEVSEEEEKSFADFGTAGSLADLDDISDEMVDSDDRDENDSDYDSDSMGSEYDGQSIDDAERSDYRDSQDDDSDEDSDDDELDDDSED